MLKTNPKKYKEHRRPRPKYVKTGDKELYVDLMYNNKRITVLVTSPMDAPDDELKGFIIERQSSGNIKMSKEIEFALTDIISAKEVDIIQRA